MSSRSLRTSLWISLWVVSIVLTALLVGRRPAGEPATTGRPDEASRVGDEPVAAGGSGPEAIAEIERARDEIARLRRANDLLEEAMARPGQRPAGEETSGAAMETPDDAVPRKTDYYLDRYFLGKSDKQFLSGLEEAIDLGLYIAQAGEAGIAYARKRAIEAESDDEREIFLGILSRLVSRSALAAIMEYPGDPEDGEANARPPAWDWDKVRRNVEELPTAALEAYVETFNAKLEDNVREGAGDLDGAGLRVCAQLALRHGEPRAMRVFEAAWSAMEATAKTSLVEYLAFIETESSLSFLATVAGSDADDAVRLKAEEAHRALADYVRPR